MKQDRLARLPELRFEIGKAIGAALPGSQNHVAPLACMPYPYLPQAIGEAGEAAYAAGRHGRNRVEVAA